MKLKTILERVQDVEEAEKQTSKAIGTLNQQTGFLRETLGNVVEVLQASLAESGSVFEANVDKRVAAKRIELREQQDQRARDAVKQMVEAGTLVPVDVITEDTLITGRQFNLQGEISVPLIQGPYSSYTESLQGALLGKNLGFVYEGPEGKFEVTEIYKFATPAPVVEPTQEVVAPQPQSVPVVDASPIADTRTQSS